VRVWPRGQPADFQLLRRAAAARVTLSRPGPPSLPHRLRHGLGAAFAVLPVLRGPLISDGSSAFRHFLRGPTARAEPSRSLQVSPRNFEAIPSPLRTWHQRILGFVAARRLSRHVTPHGASLSLETVSHLWLPPDLPSRESSRRRPASFGTVTVLRDDALATSVSGSLRWGPGSGFAFTHLRFLGHAGRTREWCALCAHHSRVLFGSGSVPLGLPRARPQQDRRLPPVRPGCVHRAGAPAAPCRQFLLHGLVMLSKLASYHDNGGASIGGCRGKHHALCARRFAPGRARRHRPHAIHEEADRPHQVPRVSARSVKGPFLTLHSPV